MQIREKMLQIIIEYTISLSHLKQPTILIFLELFLCIIEGKKHRIMLKVIIL